MARGRIIYPDFWTDSRVIAMSPFARLFYIGTWNFTYCDAGHLPDDANGLKFKILPADPPSGDELLNEVMKQGRIVRVDLGGPYLHIPTFERHQAGSKDGRWKTRCPACNWLETHQSPPEPGRAHQNSPELTVEGRGVIGSDQEGSAPASPFCQRHPQGTDENCRACGRARVAYQAAQDAKKTKPTPTPPRGKPTPETCAHKYVAGWCVAGCEQEQPHD